MVHMLSILALGIALGAAALVSGSSEKEETAKEKEATYDRDYCREHLSASHYDNWDIDSVVYALKDNWIKQDLDKLIAYGYSFEKAIDTLVEEGKIKL